MCVRIQLVDAAFTTKDTATEYFEAPVTSTTYSAQEAAGPLVVVNDIPEALGQTLSLKINEGSYYPEGFHPQKPELYRDMLGLIKTQIEPERIPLSQRHRYIRRPRDVDYRPLQEVCDVETTNQRLSSILALGIEAPELLRNMRTPPVHIFTELARCVRFAQSDAQKRVD